MATRPAASAAILTISLELAAVGAFTLLAGASDEAGTVMVIIMIGLWLIYAISETGVLYNVTGAFKSLVTYPNNNAVYYGSATGGLYESFGPGTSMALPAPSK